MGGSLVALLLCSRASHWGPPVTRAELAHLLGRRSLRLVFHHPPWHSDRGGSKGCGWHLPSPSYRTIPAREGLQSSRPRAAISFMGKLRLGKEK